MLKQKLLSIGILIFFLPLSSFSQSFSLMEFIFIKGGTFRSGDIVTNQNRLLVRVEDFEMLDHPVTNQEYQQFIDATGYQAPLHWKNNSIPAGKEDYPVIYVNRDDVDAYLAWLTKIEGRVYRLPTIIEFEYAARGGLADKKYPWGDDDPKGKANYEEEAKRRFDHWQDHLKPARWNKPNGYGLYGMAGNVWHLSANLLDPATTPFKYRITNIQTLEGRRMGGSWARSAEYLRCGYGSEFSSGIRHPDAGFRPIRQPDGTDWRILPRKLCAVSRGNGKVFLSWALLAEDNQKTRFNVFRATSRNHAGFLITEKPITGATWFLDEQAETSTRYHYYIRSVDQNGKQGRRSEWIGVNVTAETSAIAATFQPLYKQGSLVPVFGDLNGDGVPDCVIKLDNGNKEMSQDPGIPVQLEAFASYGRSLWRRDVCYHDHCYGSASNVPFNVWDMDDDGKAEVITRLQISDSIYVAILDGMIGELKYKTPWPDMVTDFQRSSTRIHLSIGYLDGVHPAVITQTGLYENEVFVAYDCQLKKLWQFNSFAETNGSAGHKIEVADVDRDGRQEVFNGTTCLNFDGSIRWSIYRQHPDIVSIHDYLPDRPGLEVFYVVESNAHAGAYMVQAHSGDIIWKVNREDDSRWTHGHVGWTADIWSDSPGIECVSNRAGHQDQNLLLFAADGKVIMEPFPWGYTPVEWDGDTTRELLSESGHRLGNFNGKEIINVPEIEPNNIPNSHLLMVADLYGDFRDELVLLTTTENGGKAVTVVTATSPIDKMYFSRDTNRDYQLWLARNMGGGYQSVYDQPLQIFR